MSKYINKKKAILLTGVLSVYLLIITPLLIINLQKQQNIRSRAANTNINMSPGTNQYNAASACSSVPADIMIIIDRSGSMAGTKLTEAQTAAQKFIDIIAEDTRNQIGLVAFSTTANLESPLTTDFTTVKNKIAALFPAGSTCHECAITKANQEISSHGRAGIKKVIILLTDGQANYIIGGTSQTTPEIAETKAFDAVKTGFSTNKTAYYTIGFGLEGKTGLQGYNGEFLQKITTFTGGKYYYPAPGELEQVYKEISVLIGKGLLSGFVFQDLNNNSAFDQNEPMQSGRNIEVISSTGTQTVTTNSVGSFTITGLCDGTYTLKQTPVSGWIQTLPTDPNGYPVTITNGNSFTDKNFGNAIAPTATPTPSPIPTSLPTPTFTPTPTRIPTATLTPSPTPTNSPTPTINPTPATTFLSLTLYQHGIGTSGDNTNPTQSDFSNKNPFRQKIQANLELFNTENQLIGQGQGDLTYNPSKGNYQGTAGIYPNDFPTGKYYLKVKTDYHLKKLTPGIITIIAQQTNTIPATTLVTGNANNDNALSILDYNMLLDCYSDLTQASSCNPAKKTSTDFNDDTFVNQVDYNLFLREIATQPGE